MAIASHDAEERTASSTATAISIEAVDKTFRLPHQQYSTLKERLLHPRGASSHDRLHALRDVSFDVRQGEFFGIVGRNGSGKSTLLKCLAGIYRLNSGSIKIAGRVSPFIELGVGFNQEMAARDNIILNGVMLGLTPREARERVDEVIAFAELEDFVDLKLKNYSSGMQVRLAFAVMVQVNADVLLIDEILAVGDAAFQQKCFDVFFRLRDEGKTIVLVTHDMAAVDRFCHRAVLLEEGRVVALGDPSEVADRYMDMNFEPGTDADPAAFGGERGGDGGARVLEAWIEDENGDRSDTVPQGTPCVFRARVRFNEELRDPEFSVAFINSERQNVFVAKDVLGDFAAGDEAVVGVVFHNALAPGRYALSALLTHRGGGGAPLDRLEYFKNIVVTGARPGGGLVDLAHDVSVQRVDP